MAIRFIFMHDNDPKHSSKVVKNWSKDNHVVFLDCPYLNPIAHLWIDVKSRLKHQKLPLLISR